MAEYDEHLNDEMIRLERELEQELDDLPIGDRENLSRAPHMAYVTLYTSDVEELADFYTAVFGFDRRYEGTSSVELNAGQQLILGISEEGYLMEVAGLDHLPPSHNNRCSTTFQVEDVDRCSEAAMAMGATILKEPHDTDWGMRSCWLRDPAGHLIEIGRWIHK